MRAAVMRALSKARDQRFATIAEFIERFTGKAGPSNAEVAQRKPTAAHEQPLTFRQLLSEIARALGKKIKFVSLPWRLLWAGLKTAEACGLRLNFRSDSLVSLMYQNPSPDFSANAAAGLICRPFEVQKLRL